ncbi:MAG: hypothetical protein V2I54_07180 [Bacteroidales bacterium]|jgi:hypothetical protein|nr:hypothetical protein [Bacteroidales bacterium]
MKKLSIVTLFIIIITGCEPQPKEITQVKTGPMENYEVIADTIINDVLIKNPGDDEWIDYCLRRLDKTSLVDYIFNSVYEEDLIPHDFFNDRVLTIDDIKAMEKNPEFDRNNIAKVQYEEAWYYNKKKHSMIKKVHSIMLAYEIYNNQGEIKGYKPAFKVYFNHESIQ